MYLGRVPPENASGCPVAGITSLTPIPDSPDARADALACWLRDDVRLPDFALAPASADASFRRYFRATLREGWPATPGAASLIAMDAPPPQEDCRPFVHVAHLLAQAGVHAPRVLASDLARGFLLLTDLGTTTYAAALDAQSARALYADALDALVRWQLASRADQLPPYDEALLRRELALFPDWCVARECEVTWSPTEAATWTDACDQLVAAALAQPVVAVHRDWMPRNLMVAEPNPGILDFQDAVHGPITYDIASLLRDAFISWDEEQEIDWAVRYWQAARKAGLPLADDFGEFWRALEWMGLQRHLKVLGIFCRLKHRDAKPAYSADLPRFYAYAHKAAVRYAALRPLAQLIEPLMGANRLEAFY